MKILLIGKNGQIGAELARLLPSLGEVTAFGRADADLVDGVWLRTTIRLLEPQLIVNAAAYTKVDEAEDHPELAGAVNSLAPAILAEEAAQLGAALVHYSTDYVFDGEKREPYLEDDEPNPLSVYGETKLDAEKLIEITGAAALVLRTSWVYGLRGESFVSKVFKKAATESELRVVADQISRPTWSLRVAQATVEIIRQCIRDGSFPDDFAGLYHLASSGSASKYAWAKAILYHSDRDPLARLVATMMDESPTPAARPRYSALDCHKLEERFGIRLPDWRDDLSLALSAQHLPASVAAKLAVA